MGLAEIRIPAGVTQEECNRHISTLLSISDASCLVSLVDSESRAQSIIITIESYPEVPYENNVYNHNGNPPLSYFRCGMDYIDRDNATDPFCDLEDVMNSSLPLYSECGNHGNCDSVL